MAFDVHCLKTAEVSRWKSETKSTIENIDVKLKVITIY